MSCEITSKGTWDSFEEIIISADSIASLIELCEESIDMGNLKSFI